MASAERRDVIQALKSRLCDAPLAPRLTLRPAAKGSLDAFAQGRCLAGVVSTLSSWQLARNRQDCRAGDAQQSDHME